MQHPLPQNHLNTYHSTPVAEFKLVLIGDGGVGKTTYVKRHKTGEFEKKYIATQGVEVTQLTFFTNYGPIRLNIWDTAGQEKLGALREGYYIGADAAFIMFDMCSRITYKDIPKWYKDLVRICDNIPVCLIGNKVDSKDRKIKGREITFHRKKNLQFYNISAKSNFQIEKPFVWILKKLTNEPNLYLVEEIGYHPPAPIEVSEEQLKQLQAELEQISSIPLPDEEEEFL